MPFITQLHATTSTSCRLHLHFLHRLKSINKLKVIAVAELQIYLFQLLGLVCGPHLIFGVLRNSISNNVLSREQFLICYLFTFFAIPTPGKYGPPNSIFELVYICSTAVWTLTSIRPLLAKNKILYVADSTETYSRSHLDMKTSGRIWEIPLAKHSLYYT